MSAKIIDGKALAAQLKGAVQQSVEPMTQKPGIGVILVGETPASRSYADGKKRDCKACGIYSEEYNLLEQTSQEEVLELISTLNEREDIDGIFVEMPLPSHINGQVVLNAIRPDKDLDGMHPHNLGQLLLGQECFRPCTPDSVMRLLEEYEIDLTGKHCVIVGRSNIVGKPLSLLMVQKHATVTVCHSKTQNLKEMCLQADILVSAAGQIGLITGDMIREGAVVVDVAMNCNEEGKLCGDVVYEEALEKASYITPVPGGVGPMTRVMVLQNALSAAKRHGKN